MKLNEIKKELKTFGRGIIIAFALALFGVLLTFKVGLCIVFFLAVLFMCYLLGVLYETLYN